MIKGYIKNGFVKAATIVRTNPFKGSKYGLVVEYAKDVSNDPGVYLLVKDEEILKIGECINLSKRITNYKSHSGPTNDHVREGLTIGEQYDIYYLACPTIPVSFGGVSTVVGISYKDLEKKLINQYLDLNGNLPILNKGKA